MVGATAMPGANDAPAVTPWWATQPWRWLVSSGVACGAFAYLMAYPLHLGGADESHLLNGARRVLAGETLYSEILEIIPPLAFYLFVAVYWIAGMTLEAARAAMAIVNALGALAFHRVATRHAGPAEALLGTLVFLVLCLPIWPYASAHWISTGLALAVAATVLGHTNRTTWMRPLAAGVLTGIAIGVQHHRGALLSLWLPVAWAILARGAPAGQRWRTTVRLTTWSVIGAVAVTAPVFGLALWRSTPAAVAEMLFGFAATSYRGNHIGPGWANIAPLTNPWVLYGWQPLLRAAPLFPVLELVHLVRRRVWDDATRRRLAVVALAAFTIAGVIYNPDAIHAAFVLPVLLLPGLSLLHDLRTSPRFTRSRALQGLAQVAVWGMVAMLVARGATNVERARAAAPMRWESRGFGPLETDPGMRELYEVVDRHLAVEPDGRRLLYSIPADAWLYLALDADNATRFDVLVPGLFPDRWVEEVAAVIRARLPGTVVTVKNFPLGPIGGALAGAYDVADETKYHRIYTRRATPR
jgi:hypothetical protein